MEQEEHKNIIERSISTELKESFMAYAMSVIVSRAIPDVRDGLKPVHRRILYSMLDLGLWANKPTKKCARIVGEVIGKYHPHGDSAVYEALVRMAQEFSLRHILVKGQGNFGSIDGDPPAAMRYTEAKFSKIAEEMITDIDKDTVNLVPNYDNSLKEPSVLPAKIPNLLINGASGIAVGMATNIPTHNLIEVCDALIEMVDNPAIEIDEIMNHIKGPDFPTGATIINEFEMKQIYSTGRGSIYLRSNYHIEENKKKKKIVFTEIPYKTNKSNLLEHIARVVNGGIVKGITDIRDESDKDGVRVVVEVSINADPELVVNNLYKHTELETSFPMNLLVLDKSQPKLMNIKEVLEAYIEHRIEVTKRWLAFDIKKLEAKLHLLEGLMIAIQNLDETIKIIKSSKDPSTAKQRLMERFKLDELQSQAILDMKLQKLTGLEIDKLKTDYDETKKKIEGYKEILGDMKKLMELIKNEIIEMKTKYGNPRKTELINAKTTKNFNFREFVKNKMEAVLLTEKGYIKRMDLETYKVQNRAGKGMRATKMEEDKIKEFTIANTHDILYLFTNKGRLYTMDCYSVPEASRNAKGRYLANFLKLEEDERITNIMAITEEIVKDANKYFVTIVSKYGKIKRMPFDYIKKIRSNGLRVITLNENDRVVAVKLLTEDNKILIVSFAGKAVQFTPSRVRPMGRTAMGVKAMNLGDSEIVSVNVVNEEDEVLFVSKKGYGKKTIVNEFRETNRGTKGVKAMDIKKAGAIVKSLIVTGKDEIMIVTDKGIAIRISLDKVPILSRNTKGVTLIKLDDKDYVHDVSAFESNGEIEESEELNIENQNNDTEDENKENQNNDEDKKEIDEVNETEVVNEGGDQNE
jgi:DNA gyrase subunit A